MSTYAVTDTAALPDPLPADVTVLDVRQPEEWAAGHVAGAVHIPLGELTQRTADLPDGPLLVVCRVGARSERACGWLARQGYDVTNLAGGLQDWEDAGRPLVDDHGAPGQVA